MSTYLLNANNNALAISPAWETGPGFHLLKTMSESKMGAIVQYGGHDASFVADIFRIGNVNVVQANGPITEELLTRPADPACTHHVGDFPECGYWRPNRGVFVVPEKQCVALKPESGARKSPKFVKAKRAK